jgi:hypothetical protein
MPLYYSIYMTLCEKRSQVEMRNFCKNSHVKQVMDRGATLQYQNYCEANEEPNIVFLRVSDHDMAEHHKTRSQVTHFSFAE